MEPERREPGLSARRVLKVALALVVATATLSTAPPTSAGESCAESLDVFPVEDLREDMRGTGFTVVEGRDPVGFGVKILGVLEDGIAPGVDFILVKVSGPVIRRTGGIAAGFSGSPVYIDGRLVGAIAYGFFGADQTVGGVTPAEAMVSVLDYPRPRRGPEHRPAREIRLSDELRDRAARAAGVRPRDFPESARQLPVPLAVSGLNDRAMEKLTEVMSDQGLPFIPYRTASAETGGGVEDRLRPGDSLGASASVGDLTFAGVGTLTAVCGRRGVGFGHPFFFEGNTLMGMHAADVVTVVRDPSSLFGPFKIATIEEMHGRIDQDRLAAIRSFEGELPAMVPVRSEVVNPDLNRTRQGTTQVIKQESSGFPLLPSIAAFHLLLNQDVVFDRLGDGTVSLEFTANGIGPSGEPFRFVRTNMHFSDFDVSFMSIFEVLSVLEAIQSNPFGDVTFTRVTADSEITERHLVTDIERVLSASSVQPELKERERLIVVPGDTVRLRVILRPEGRDRTRAVDLSLAVPSDAEFGGSLVVRGGGQEECFFCFEEPGDGDGGEPGEDEPATFEELLADLRNAERHNELVASLALETGGGETAVAPQDLVVRGFEEIFLRIRGGREE